MNVFTVGITKYVLLITINKLPKVVRFPFVTIIFIKFEIMNGNYAVDYKQIVYLVLKIFLHTKSIT